MTALVTIMTIVTVVALVTPAAGRRVPEWVR